MSFDEVVQWFESLRGRDVHVILYVNSTPVATLDGRLQAGVRQDVPTDVGSPHPPPVAYGVGPAAAFALDSRVFVSAETVGGSITLKIGANVELLAHPWRDGSVSR